MRQRAYRAFNAAGRFIPLVRRHRHGVKSGDKLHKIAAPVGVGGAYYLIAVRCGQRKLKAFALYGRAVFIAYAYQKILALGVYREVCVCQFIRLAAFVIRRGGGERLHCGGAVCKVQLHLRREYERTYGKRDAWQQHDKQPFIPRLRHFFQDTGKESFHRLFFL